MTTSETQMNTGQQIVLATRNEGKVSEFQVLLKDFDIEDTEQYFMHIDPNVKVLATTTFGDAYDPWIKGAVMPVSWKKYYGKGRVFYLSIGHNPKDFDNPSAWALLTRGIAWASDSKNGPVEQWISPVYPSHSKLK